VEPETNFTWVFDEATQAMKQKNISYVPGLYKIFDEILVNAADNKQRDPSMNGEKQHSQISKNILNFRSSQQLLKLKSTEKKDSFPSTTTVREFP